MNTNPFTSQTAAVPTQATQTETPRRGHRGPRSPEMAARQRARQEETAAIRDYLEHIAKYGKRRRRDNYERSLDAVETKLSLGNLTAVERLTLIQRKRDLERMINEPLPQDNAEQFIKYAASYSERKGIEYATWREFGVQAKVLKRAGIKS